MSGKKNQKKRGIFPKVATNILRAWLFQHLTVRFSYANYHVLFNRTRIHGAYRVYCLVSPKKYTRNRTKLFIRWQTISKKHSEETKCFFREKKKKDTVKSIRIIEIRHGELLYRTSTRSFTFLASDQLITFRHDIISVWTWTIALRESCECKKCIYTRT